MGFGEAGGVIWGMRLRGKALGDIMGEVIGVGTTASVLAKQLDKAFTVFGLGSSSGLTMVMGGAHMTTSGSGATSSLGGCSILTVLFGGAGGVGGFSNCLELNISTRPLMLNCWADGLVGELVELI